MNQPIEPMPGHEPSLHTVEMVCDRLAELGLAVGPDTALQTIRVAAQSAMGVLATTTPAESRPRPDAGTRAEPRPPSAPRRTPASGRRQAEADDVERRPIFRRPRGR